MRLVLGLAAFAAALVATSAYADEAEIHTFHCIDGCPMGTAGTNDLIVREIYTLSSNDRTRFADWVAYRVTSTTVGQSGSRGWQADPWLADSETLEPDDYNDAPAALGIDRGHQAPLAAFSGTPTASDTNILSNITPQSSDLNQASWQYLEAQERDYVGRPGPNGRARILYVLTGPLYERVMPPLPMPAGRERHRVPSGYWKIIRDENGGLSAFIFDQATTRTADYCDMRVPLEDVELRTNLTFFPRLIERRFSSLDTELGCPLPPGVSAAQPTPPGRDRARARPRP